MHTFWCQETYFCPGDPDGLSCIGCEDAIGVLVDDDGPLHRIHLVVDFADGGQINYCEDCAEKLVLLPAGQVAS